MKILVINNQFEEKHLNQIKKAAGELGCEVFFYKSEGEIPESNFDADIIYGFAPSIVKTSKTLKWLCVPWAGVDSLMPDGAYIVNVGRGSAIDEEALADNLDNGHIAGAALDVFQTEPLPKNHRLWKTKNLLITPHIAGNMTLPYTKDKNVQMFIEDLKNFAEGKTLRYLVDRKLGY